MPLLGGVELYCFEFLNHCTITMSLWRQQIDQWFPGIREERELNRQSAGGFQDSKTILCDIRMMDTVSLSEL